MKKRLATVAAVLCLTGALAAGMAACSTPSSGSTQPADKPAAQQPADDTAAKQGAEADLKDDAAQQQAATAEADKLKMLPQDEKAAAAAELYAPKVTKAANGADVQLIPADPYMWNTAILDGENRGCLGSSCHDSLLDTNQLLPMPHPKLWNPYDVEATTKFCYMCHSKALFMQDSMHAIHMNSAEFAEKGGNCDSCHYISPQTGEYLLWDLAKYNNAYMGITPVPNVTGDFSFTQDSITPTDQVFYYWENANHQGVTPDNDTSQAAYDSWEIAVGGEVENPFTFKLTDFEDQMVEKVLKMDCQTNPPGGAYVANVNVKGIPLSVIMERAGVKDTANTLHSVADDGWDVYPVPLSTVNEYLDDILLVTEINGEPLGMLQGFPVQLWIPPLGGCHYTKRVVNLNFTNDATEARLFQGFTNPKTGEMFNKPNTAIFYTAQGTIFPAGQPIELEGFADAYDVPMTAVEISMDKGATWTTYDLGETDVMRWVDWKFSFTPEKPGSYLIQVRGVAADGSVSTDPSQLFFNVK